MTLHLYLDENLTDPISEGDLTHPDQDSFNGTDGEAKDRQLFLANEQTTLSDAVTAEQTTLPLAEPRFSTTDVIAIGSEQLQILSGHGTPTVSVQRGYGGTAPIAHAAGAIVTSGYDYEQIEVSPMDESGTDEATWIFLAESQAGLDSAVAGMGLPLGAKSHTESRSFWRRVQVPPNTPVQNKTDLKLRVTALENPIL